jgi:hypothetical protein
MQMSCSGQAPLSHAGSQAQRPHTALLQDTLVPRGLAGCQGMAYLTEPDLSGQVLDELRGSEVLREFVLMLRQSLWRAGSAPALAIAVQPLHTSPGYPCLSSQDHGHPNGHRVRGCHGTEPGCMGS